MTLHSPAAPLDPETLAAPSLDWLEPLLNAVRNGMPPREAAAYAGMLPAELTAFLDGHYSAALAVALAEADCLKCLLADALAPVVRGTARRPLAAIKWVLERRFPKAFARLPAPKKKTGSSDPEIAEPVPQRRPAVLAEGDEADHPAPIPLIPPIAPHRPLPSPAIAPFALPAANRWAGYRVATRPGGC